MLDLREELLKVREQLLNTPTNVKFNMEYFLTDVDQYVLEDMPETEVEEAQSCGTVACIAGHIYTNNKEYFDSKYNDVYLDQVEIEFVSEIKKESKAKAIRSTLYELFMMDDYMNKVHKFNENLSEKNYSYGCFDMATVTKEEAIAAIDMVLETGKIKWSKIIPINLEMVNKRFTS